MFHKELELNMYRTYPKITHTPCNIEQTRDGHVKSVCLYGTLEQSDTKDTYYKYKEVSKIIYDYGQYHINIRGAFKF